MGRLTSVASNVAGDTNRSRLQHVGTASVLVAYYQKWGGSMTRIILARGHGTGPGDRDSVVTAAIMSSPSPVDSLSGSFDFTYTVRTEMAPQGE